MRSPCTSAKASECGLASAALRLAGASPENSLFGREIPCSDMEISLFGEHQGNARKRLDSLLELTSRKVEIGRNDRKSPKFPDNFPVLREIGLRTHCGLPECTPKVRQAHKEQFSKVAPGGGLRV